MCSSQPPENGADSDPALWTHQAETLPAIVFQLEWIRPPWVERAVNGGWDKPQEEVSSDAKR
jgi:hypothetical protein